MSSRCLVLIVKFGLALFHNTLELTFEGFVSFKKKKKDGVKRMAFHVKRESKSNQCDFHAASGKPCRTPQTRQAAPTRRSSHHHSCAAKRSCITGAADCRPGSQLLCHLPQVGGFWLTPIPPEIDKALILKNILGSQFLAWGISLLGQHSRFLKSLTHYT